MSRAPVSCPSAVLRRPATAFPPPETWLQGLRAELGELGEGSHEGPATPGVWGGLGTCWAEKDQPFPGCSEVLREHWLLSGGHKLALSRFRSKANPTETEPFSLQGGGPVALAIGRVFLLFFV